MFIPEIEQGQLSNGARYALAHIPNVKFLNGELNFLVGYADEKPEEHGLAHFFEHSFMAHAPKINDMVFIDHFKNNQVTANATTSNVKTFHSFSGLRDRALGYFNNLNNIVAPMSFEQDLIDKEKSRVISEINESVDNTKRNALLHHRGLVFSGHPYARDALGTKEYISELTPEEVYQFYQTHYRAEKTLLSMTGNIDKNKVLDRLESIAGLMPKGKSPERSNAQYNPAYGQQQDNSKTVAMSMSFINPYEGFEDYNNLCQAYGSLNSFLNVKIMEVGSHYSLGYTSLQMEDALLATFHLICEPEKAQEDTISLINHMKMFDHNDMYMATLKIKNGIENTEAVRAEAYYWRTERMSNQLYYYGKIIDDQLEMKMDNDISVESISKVYKNMMKQIPSVTFYGNVNAANLPDNNQWVAEAMKL